MLIELDECRKQVARPGGDCAVVRLARRLGRVSRTGRGISARTTAGPAPSRRGRWSRCRTRFDETHGARHFFVNRNGLLAGHPDPGGGPAQDVVPGPRLPVQVPSLRLRPARYVMGADAAPPFVLRNFDRAVMVAQWYDSRLET